jgi:hypothetical protein
VARQRPQLGTPFGTEGPWLAAILDVLGDVHDLLEQRLPQAQKGPVRVTEPAPAPARPAVVPVSEPAPDVPPDQAQPVTEPNPDDEPNPDGTAAEPRRDLPEPPPRSGRGAGLKAWQRFADLAGVTYEPADSRDDVIAACELAGVIPEEGS